MLLFEQRLENLATFNPTSGHTDERKFYGRAVEGGQACWSTMNFSIKFGYTKVKH